RGTIDVLLGWPVSRGAVYLSETIVWVAAGAVLLLSGFLGSQIAALTLPIEQRPEGALVLLALANFFAVYVVVGSVTQLVAAAGNRRAATMGVALAFVLASFLFNFLAQFWAPAERVVFASFVHYYQPAAVMLQGAVPIRDIAILLAWGGVAWALGYVVWRRRSVLTI
ncbi:MAG: ABC transporter permease subunit, partial [Planctomycetota bacterium]|nr:ABC transporter permease subunit [Planctomycetota bacterium]